MLRRLRVIAALAMMASVAAQGGAEMVVEWWGRADTCRHKGMTVEHIHELTYIDRWFLQNIRQIVELENEIRTYRGKEWQTIPDELLERAKEFGFSDIQLARLLGIDEVCIFKFRHEKGVVPAYKLVDTCAAEFEAFTPYFYSTYEMENEILDRRT